MVLVGLSMAAIAMVLHNTWPWLFNNFFGGAGLTAILLLTLLHMEIRGTSKRMSNLLKDNPDLLNRIKLYVKENYE